MSRRRSFLGRSWVALVSVVTLVLGGLVAMAAPASAATCAIAFDGTTISTVSALQAELDATQDPTTGTCRNAGDVVTVTFTANLTTGGTALEWRSTYLANLTLQGTATLAAPNSGRVLFARSATSVVTIDGLTITGGAEPNYGGAVFSQGDLVVRNATFNDNNTGTSYGSAIGSSSGVELTIVNSTFSSNGTTADEGGAIYWEGDVTITDSTFTSNVAREGGAIWHSAGNLTITGSTFTSNNAADTNGGAIYSSSSSVLSVSSSTLNSNSADDFGGAIYNVGTATISDTTFDGNESQDDDALGEKGGGAVAHRTGTLTVSGSTFTNNETLDFDGGAIFNGSGGTVSVSSSTFRDNTADDSGGAISSNVSSVSASINGSTFSGNSGRYMGGAVFAARELAVTGSTFTSNSSESDGGAISAWNDFPFTVDSSQFSGNSARRNGGAIETYNGRSATITASTFASNTASQDGGAVYFVDAGSVTNSTITGNSARDGGGVYLNSEEPFVLDFVTLVSNSASRDGANMRLADGDAPVTVRGTVIGNVASPSVNCSNRSATWTVIDSVIDSAESASCGAGFTAASWSAIALGSLADNGGPTQTMMPAKSSVLVGFVTDGTVTALTSVDQRGYARSGAYTAGAVEWSESTPTPGPAPDPEPSSGGGVSTPTPVAPNVTAPIPVQPGISTPQPGAVLSTLGGGSETVTVRPNQTRDGLLIGGLNWGLTVDGMEYGGDAAPLASPQILQVQKGQQVVITGYGYAPNSVVSVYLYGPSVFVGTLTTGADGSFQGSLLVPSGVDVGMGTLQINGYAPSGQIRSVDIGVKIRDAALTSGTKLRQKVFFEAYSAELTDKDKRELQAFLKQIPKDAKVSTLFHGYAGKNAKDPQKAAGIARNRAQSTADYMLSIGLKGEVYTSGMGKSSKSGRAGRTVIVKVTYQ